MTEGRSLLVVGKLRPERKRSLSGMAVAAELPPVAFEESAEAIEWLDTSDPGCVIVDAGVNRLDKLIAKLRSKRHLTHVPVFALVSTPDDLWIEQYYNWGGDDIVQVDAGATLLERLRAVPREAPRCHPNRRIAIGDPDKARTEVIARVFGLAGFEVNSAIDRKSLEFYVAQHNPPVVVANAILGELPELIARTRQNGSRAAWIVTAARRELELQQVALNSVERCAVMGVQATPWQILYRSNELSRESHAERRTEARRNIGSFVLFRAAGSDDDDVGVAYNLSSRGMFIRTFAPVLSDDVWLEWRVPQDKTRVRLEGRVVWRQTSLSDATRAASPLGFGVEFCDYLGGARKHLERALEVLDGGARKSVSSRPAPSGGADPAPPARERVETGLATKPVSLPPAVGRLGQPKPLSLGAALTSKAGVAPANQTAKPAEKGESVAPPPDKDSTSTEEPRKASVRPPAAASTPPKRDSKLDGAGLGAAGSPAMSQALTKRAPVASTNKSVPQPTPAPRTVPKMIAPPRPLGGTPAVLAPPRPSPARPELAVTVASNAAADAFTGKGASATVANELGSIASTLGQIPPQRFDTLRDAVAFDDLAEKTDTGDERELIEEAPNSSEPTEIRQSIHALFEAVDEAKHSLQLAGDDAPTVITNSLDAAARLNPPSPSDDSSPPAGRAVEESFDTDEQATKQWNVGAVAPSGGSDEDTDVALPVQRRSRVGAIVGVVVVGFVLIGGGLYWHSLGVNSAPKTRSQGPTIPSATAVSDGPTVPLAKAVPIEGAGPSSDGAAAQAPSNAPPAGALPGEGGVDAGPASPPGEIPLAKVDDGSPLEGYPAVEDPFGGKGRLLADRYGYLIVRFPEAAFIFSNNIAMGATNWKIPTTCGEKTLRIGLGEKPTTWLSSEARVNVQCRGTTRVVFERLAGVVSPPGATRPIAPGSLPARKSAAKTGDDESAAVEASPEVKPTEGERGIVDTRE